MPSFQGGNYKKSSLRTRAAFLDAFLQLMKKHSFDEITVSDIIKQAGYSRTTFYSYYQDKFDMVSKFLADEAVEFVNAVCGPIPSDSKMTFDTEIYLPGLSLFKHIYQVRDFYSLLIHNRLPGYSMDTLCLKLSQCFQAVISVEMSEPIDDLDFGLYCYITSDTYLTFVKYWERNDFTLSPEYMAKQMMINFVKVKKVTSVATRNLPPTFNLLETMD